MHGTADAVQPDASFLLAIEFSVATGVTGAGFITLAATLSVVPSVPIESLAILVGIDRFMSECRALVNLVGNGIATVVVSPWEKELAKEELNANLLKSQSLVDITP
jgi:aerobic C4-dicarboxylate transport protein